MLEVVREQPYFRLYSVDILASCEYLPQELFECYTESCEIYPAEEGEVRLVLRSLQEPAANQSSRLFDSLMISNFRLFLPPSLPPSLPP